MLFCAKPGKFSEPLPPHQAPNQKKKKIKNKQKQQKKPHTTHSVANKIDRK